MTRSAGRALRPDLRRRLPRRRDPGASARPTAASSLQRCPSPAFRSTATAGASTIAAPQSPVRLRTLRSATTPASQRPDRRLRARRPIRRARSVLQYWLLLRRTTRTGRLPGSPFGFIWQAHEGDWEVVHVVLSDDKQTPVEAAYSQHLHGSACVTGTTSRRLRDEPPACVLRCARLARELLHPGRPSDPADVLPRRGPAVLPRLLGIPPRDVATPGTMLGPGHDRRRARPGYRSPRVAPLPGHLGRGAVHRGAAVRRAADGVRHVAGRPRVPGRLARPARDDRRLRAGLTAVPPSRIGSAPIREAGLPGAHERSGALRSGCDAEPQRGRREPIRAGRPPLRSRPAPRRYQ